MTDDFPQAWREAGFEPHGTDPAYAAERAKREGRTITVIPPFGTYVGHVRPDVRMVVGDDGCIGGPQHEMTESVRKALDEHGGGFEPLLKGGE